MLVRQAAVAGVFYPQDPEQLITQLAEFLAPCRPPADDKSSAPSHPKAIIVPHAGYLYSGQVAARAYASLQTHGGEIKRVVLVGPAHREYTQHCVLPNTEYFSSPLGQVAIDRQSYEILQTHPRIAVSDQVHLMEHSLEVQLPFLQLCLTDFMLLPILVGHVPAQTVSEVLGLVWGGAETLIVVSSDLSHFHEYQLANTLDRETCRDIEERYHHLSGEQACGCTAINGLMIQAAQRQLYPHLLEYKNSGDTAGNKSKVVGYASFAIF